MRNVIMQLDRAACVAQLVDVFGVSTTVFSDVVVPARHLADKFSAAQAGPIMFASERVFKKCFACLYTESDVPVPRTSASVWPNVA